MEAWASSSGWEGDRRLSSTGTLRLISEPSFPLDATSKRRYPVNQTMTTRAFHYATQTSCLKQIKSSESRCLRNIPPSLAVGIPENLLLGRLKPPRRGATQEQSLFLIRFLRHYTYEMEAKGLEKRYIRTSRLARGHTTLPSAIPSLYSPQSPEPMCTRGLHEIASYQNTTGLFASITVQAMFFGYRISLPRIDAPPVPSNAANTPFQQATPASRCNTTLFLAHLVQSMSYIPTSRIFLRDHAGKVRIQQLKESMRKVLLIHPLPLPLLHLHTQCPKLVTELVAVLA
jgi:hypothetical protein